MLGSWLDRTISEKLPRNLKSNLMLSRMNNGEICRKKNNNSCHCTALLAAASLLFTYSVVATGGHFKQTSKAQMRDKGLVIVSVAGLWARNCQDLILSTAPGLMEHVRAKVCCPGPSLGSVQMASRLSPDRHSGTISLRWSSWGKH